MKQGFKCSKEFKRALANYQEENELNRHVLAVKLKTYPTLLSYIHTDKMLFGYGDQRILKIARKIGFKGECFEVVTTK